MKKFNFCAGLKNSLKSLLIIMKNAFDVFKNCFNVHNINNNVTGFFAVHSLTISNCPLLNT